MDIHKKRKDAVLVGVEAVAGLAIAARAAEAMLTAGVYHFDCVGPVEEHRPRFIELRDRLFAAGHQRIVEQVIRDGGYQGAAYDSDLSDRELDDLIALASIPMESKWSDDVHNLVTTVGKNDILDKYLAGSTYTASPVMGLKGTGSAAAGDTQASHAGWLEVGLANAPTYSGNRGAPSFSAASGGVKATSSAVSFSITSTGTVAGCFINNGGSSTKDNTTGVLVSAGDFSGGSKSVGNGDTLNVSYSLTLS